MIPIIVLLLGTISARLAGLAGVDALDSWQISVRAGLAGMLLLTGSAHWGRRRADLIAMVPDRFPRPGLLVTLTGALELAGNLPSFDDLVAHPTINVDDLDPQCDIPGLVIGQPRKLKRVDAILNNSFGMLGINSTLIIKRFKFNT